MHEARTAWQAALDLHAALSAGHAITAITAPIRTEPGEHAVGHWPTGFTTQRQATAPPPRNHSPRWIVGTPQFLLSYAAGTTITELRAHRRVHPTRWTPPADAHIVATTWRLLCQFPDMPQWTGFDHNHIQSIDLAGYTLTLYYTDTYPLRLNGPWAPWLATYLCHHLYGLRAARLPQLAPLATDRAWQPARI